MKKIFTVLVTASLLSVSLTGCMKVDETVQSNEILNQSSGKISEHSNKHSENFKKENKNYKKKDRAQSDADNVVRYINLDSSTVVPIGEFKMVMQEDLIPVYQIADEGFITTYRPGDFIVLKMQEKKHVYSLSELNKLSPKSGAIFVIFKGTETFAYSAIETE